MGRFAIHFCAEK
jgi:Aldo/keto reductase family